MQLLKELFGFILFKREDELFEMGNLAREDTGLRMTIWFSTDNHSSGPRIKANFDGSLSFNKRDNFTVTISDHPQVMPRRDEAMVIKKIGQSNLDDLCDWILINKQPLLDYWNSKISTSQLLTQLKPL